MVFVISLSLGFGSFCQEKEQSQPAATERADVVITT
jgi:hypothetical protein